MQTGSGRKRDETLVLKFGYTTASARSSGVLFILCPRSLKLIGIEGICGRFGRIGVEIVSISGLVGNVRDHATDDLVESFTVCGSRYFGNLAHDCKLT